MISGCNANPNDEQTGGEKKKKKESEQTEPGLVWNLQRLEKSLLLTHLKKKLILSCIKTSPLTCSLMSH